VDKNNFYLKNRLESKISTFW